MANVGKSELMNPKLVHSFLEKEGEAAEKQRQFVRKLREELDRRGIEYAVIEESGCICLCAASFDEDNVKGIIAFLEAEEEKPT
jgi:hypothetical protein